MTDHFHSLTVTLDADIRDDDAQAIIDAIKQLRRVIDVSGNIAHLDMHVAEVRVKNELRQKLWDALEN